MCLKISERIVFSVFDKIKGPTVIYSTMKRQERAKKVASRSFVALGFSNKDFDITELTLPILSDKSVQTDMAFSLFFRLPIQENLKETEPAVACLSWIVPMNMATNFYVKIPSIRAKGGKIIEAIQANVRDHGIIESELTRQIIKGIATIGSVTSREESQVIIRSKSDVPTLKAESVGAGFTFLRSIPKKALHFLMQGAILGEPILIIGDKYTFNVVSDTLLLFNHQGVSRKIFLEDQPTIPGNNHAVGIHPNQKLSKNIKDSYYLTYSLDKQRIEHKSKLKECDFAKQWTSNLFKVSSIDDILINFHSYVETKIQPYVSQIIDLLAQSQDSKQNIANTKAFLLDLRKSLSKSDYDFVIELAIRSNPILEDFMRKELFAEQFVINGW
ncbi:hypothetical protein CEE45_02820 [Candidatus Heimdallarchaeota archaeon B3_Heim]|nr:MAG: hypothetical protein CEE45_02820 [Candidatus Heimdallarchaeota archaeon B3_Heim]